MAKEFKISSARLKELEDELKYLKTTREKEVAEQIKEARSFGDLSENSEYDEAKNEQAKLYGRIAEVETQEDAMDVLDELIDRFGEPPKAVLNLLAIARLKALAHRGYITEIKQMQREIRITLYENAHLNPEGIPPLVAKYRRQLQFKPDKEPKFLFAPVGDIVQALTVFAKELMELVEEEGKSEK